MSTVSDTECKEASDEAREERILRWRDEVGRRMAAAEGDVGDERPRELGEGVKVKEEGSLL